jgi:hypothetical protein
MWRLYRKRFGRGAPGREEFLAYPQTSPEIYAWLPYHREPASTAQPIAAAELPAQPPHTSAAESAMNPNSVNEVPP